MKQCCVCGYEIDADDRDGNLFAAHTVCRQGRYRGPDGETFAAETNRIWCDYFHRRVPIRRVVEQGE